MENLLLIITITLLIVVAAAAILFATPIRNLIKKKTTKEEYDTLLALAEISVRWAKQWMDTATGTEKKEEVLRYLEEKTSELGLNITADDIDKAIEAAYEKVKKETESK
jgi:LL-H family phage holin